MRPESPYHAIERRLWQIRKNNETIRTLELENEKLAQEAYQLAKQNHTQEYLEARTALASTQQPTYRNHVTTTLPGTTSMIVSGCVVTN